MSASPATTRMPVVFIPHGGEPWPSIPVLQLSLTVGLDPARSTADVAGAAVSERAERTPP